MNEADVVIAVYQVGSTNPTPTPTLTPNPNPNLNSNPNPNRLVPGWTQGLS